MSSKSNDPVQLSILLSEKDPDIVTYSKSVFYLLTQNLPSDYTSRVETKNDRLLVPYTIIKKSKEAKKKNAREIVLLASERPDRNTSVRSTLDLWGLSSYIDYLYTTSELSFLEGLIPVFEGGFLSPLELRQLSEIMAYLKILIPTTNIRYYEKKYSKDYAKKYYNIRLKMLEWAGKLSVPVVSGIIVGTDDSESNYKSTVDKLLEYNDTYNNVHSISIQSETILSSECPTKKSDQIMLKVIDYIKKSGVDIMISTPPIHMNCIESFLEAGIRDFGAVPINPSVLFPKVPEPDFDQLARVIESTGLSLGQRLPIKYDFIKNGRYSKKMGQVFDAHRYKIKKYEQEKLKELKSTL